MVTVAHRLNCKADVFAEAALPVMTAFCGNEKDLNFSVITIITS
jgi:hypothetical protein